VASRVEFGLYSRCVCARDRNLKRNNTAGPDLTGDCLILKKRIKDVNDTKLTLTICVVKDNSTLSLDDEDTEVSNQFYHR